MINEKIVINIFIYDIQGVNFINIYIIIFYMHHHNVLHYNVLNYYLIRRGFIIELQSPLKEIHCWLKFPIPIMICIDH